MWCVGWGARIRTWEWRNQNPLPYHLPTRQSARHRNPVPISCQAERATPLEGATHNARIRPGRAGDRAAGRSCRDPAVCSGQRTPPPDTRSEAGFLMPCFRKNRWLRGLAIHDSCDWSSGQFLDWACVQVSSNRFLSIGQWRMVTRR
jgi:hypothetical protein